MCRAHRPATRSLACAPRPCGAPPAPALRPAKAGVLCALRCAPCLPLLSWGRGSLNATARCHQALTRAGFPSVARPLPSRCHSPSLARRERRARPYEHLPSLGPSPQPRSRTPHHLPHPGFRHDHSEHLFLHHARPPTNDELQARCARVTKEHLQPAGPHTAPPSGHNDSLL